MRELGEDQTWWGNLGSWSELPWLVWRCLLAIQEGCQVGIWISEPGAKEEVKGGDTDGDLAVTVDWALGKTNDISIS